MKRLTITLNGKKYVRVARCNANKLKYSLAKITVVGLLFSAILSSCSCTKPTSSWEIYCAKYKVCPVHPTVEEENYFLDCYVGSEEWERDLDKYNFSDCYAGDKEWERDLGNTILNNY